MNKKTAAAAKRLHAAFSMRVDKSVGKRIAERRAFEKLTQEEIGHLLGLGGAAVSRYESGVTTITVGTLVALARGAKCHPSDLLVDFDRPGVGLERALSPDAVAMAHVFDGIKNGGLRQIVRTMADKMRSYERTILQEKTEP